MAVVTGEVVAEGAGGKGVGDVLQPAVVCHHGHYGQVRNIAQLCLKDNPVVTLSITECYNTIITISHKAFITAVTTSRKHSTFSHEDPERTEMKVSYLMCTVWATGTGTSSDFN